jgi:hypothetical protein
VLWTVTERRNAYLESVLGASPRGFESRILRPSLTRADRVLSLPDVGPRIGRDLSFGPSCLANWAGEKGRALSRRPVVESGYEPFEIEQTVIDRANELDEEGNEDAWNLPLSVSSQTHRLASRYRGQMPVSRLLARYRS